MDWNEQDQIYPDHRLDGLLLSQRCLLQCYVSSQANSVMSLNKTILEYCIHEIGEES